MLLLAHKILLILAFKIFKDIEHLNSYLQISCSQTSQGTALTGEFIMQMQFKQHPRLDCYCERAHRSRKIWVAFLQVKMVKMIYLCFWEPNGVVDLNKAEIMTIKEGVKHF